MFVYIDFASAVKSRAVGGMASLESRFFKEYESWK
jgi:hypothetical protein